EPKNSIIKQYKKMFKIDGVEIEFQEEALEAVAEKSLLLKTGARGLRAILEEAMLSIMYKIPSDKSIEKVVITKDVINENAEPMMIYKDKKEVI
ncbi:MAG: ATP-dependent Clp protease ATP-binding subunit ClpX, partial [Clostridia bacterium]